MGRKKKEVIDNSTVLNDANPEELDNLEDFNFDDLLDNGGVNADNSDDLDKGGVNADTNDDINEDPDLLDDLGLSDPGDNDDINEDPDLLDDLGLGDLGDNDSSEENSDDWVDDSWDFEDNDLKESEAVNTSQQEEIPFTNSQQQLRELIVQLSALVQQISALIQQG